MSSACNWNSVFSNSMFEKYTSQFWSFPKSSEFTPPERTRGTAATGAPPELFHWSYFQNIRWLSPLRCILPSKKEYFSFTSSPPEIEEYEILNSQWLHLPWSPNQLCLRGRKKWVPWTPVLILAPLTRLSPAAWAFAGEMSVCFLFLSDFYGLCSTPFDARLWECAEPMEVWDREWWWWLFYVEEHGIPL